jgi:putative endonuclease
MVCMAGHGRPPGQDPRRRLGARGEALVGRWYEQRGYRVLDRNWRRREGELDLVLDGGDVVVFCEVKTRRSAAYGAPAEAVAGPKQRRIRVLAAIWLRESGLRFPALRFDVASVMAPAGETPVVTVVEAAF